MPEEDYEFTPSSKLMHADEIETLARIFVAEGVKKSGLPEGNHWFGKMPEKLSVLLPHCRYT